ncbi:MAG TPA: hypothetical protein VMG99_09015 [Thermoplasmata archaeon]|nr:hypothetical protein [Thermoplasmata archaeon]
MSDLLDTWFVRHIETALPLLLSLVLLAAFTAVAYGIGPAPSEGSGLVVYGILGWMVALFFLLPRFVLGWVRRPL